jgi:hypothetical protein
LNTEGTRKGLFIVLNKGQGLPSNTDNIMTASVMSKFSAVIVDNLDNTGSGDVKYNLSLNHWFYALPPAQISIEPNDLPQNNEYGGTFDPLQ